MNVFAIISPLVIIGLLGFLTAKKQFFSKAQIDSLSKFTFYLCIPAFLFKQIVLADLSDLDINIYAAFYLPVLMIYGIAWLLNYFLHPQYQHDPAASGVFALAASYSNNVIVGLPVLLMVLGEQALLIIFMIVTLHSAMLFGITSALTATESRFNWLKFFKQTFYNPLIIAILSGFILNMLALPIPQVLLDSLALLGKPAITLALFLLGASLAFHRLSQQINYITLAVILKLLLLPLLVYLSAHHLFNFSDDNTLILVILSASPTGVNAYLIAKQQIQHQETVAGSVILSTIAATITIPFWLWWLS